MLTQRTGGAAQHILGGGITLRSGGGAASSLLTSLVSYWKLDEASGTRNDAHSTNHLTDNNTVLFAAGKIGNAADFEQSASESLSIVDNTSLRTGDISFTWAFWVNFESVPAANGSTHISKYLIAGNKREYAVITEVLLTVVRFRFYVSATGTSTVSSAIANNLGTPVAATWYYVVAWHDADANTINIQVNNGTVDSTAHTTGVNVNDAAFYMGSLNLLASYYLDGLQDEVGFWKRVLTADERTSLYNGGAGLAYPFS